jgi:tetratricopeptide (TPR) repeat protein
LASKSPLPQIGIGEVYTLTGRYEQAIATFDQAAALASGSNWLKGIRGWTLGLAGRTEEAQQVLRELQKTAAEEKVDPLVFAYVYCGLNDHDHAIEWLRKAYKERSHEMIFLRMANWDNLRSDPRFIALMKDVGLPTDSSAHDHGA